MCEQKFEVSYSDKEEKEIPGWEGRTIDSCKVSMQHADGYLTIKFTDGAAKRYGFNELGFWEKTEIKAKAS